MYKAFYAGHTLLGFPLFALLFFVAVFAFVVFRVMRPRSVAHYETISHMPLADDAEVSARGHGHV